MATAPSTKSESSDYVLHEWISPSRPFQKRSKEFFKTAGALAALIAIIAIFIGEYMLVLVIISTFVLIYALSTVPPENIKHTITTLGIDTDGYFHKWEELYEFWFDEKSGQKVVVIRTLLNFPSHLQLLIGSGSEETIKNLLVERIPYREKPLKTTLDRASEWLMQKLPLEKSTS